MIQIMRRIKQKLDYKDCEQILIRNTNGVLALKDDEYPYAVPLSYVYEDGYLYFHSALKGYKVDLINKNNNASFCIIDQDLIVPEKFTTFFRSVIVFGKVEIINDEAKKIKALRSLIRKYSKEYEIEGENEIAKFKDNASIYGLKIDYMSGKQAIELVNGN